MGTSSSLYPMQQSFLLENDTAATVPICVAFLAGIALGMASAGGPRSSSHSSFEEAAVQQVLVPLYAVLAALYLTAVAFRQDLRPAWQRLRRHIYSSSSKAREGPKAPPPTLADEATVVLPEEGAGEAEHLGQPVDLTGVYQLVSNDNFEAFLAAQGVPWALRSAANRVRPIHRITHQGHTLTIKIEGIIESQTTYHIGGPPVETSVRGRLFEDAVTYLKDGKRGVLVRKRALTEPYDVTVQRELSDDGNTITLTSQAVFRDGRPPVQSKQIFHRVEEPEQ